MEKFRSALLLLAVLTSASRAQEIIYTKVGQTVTLKPPEGFKSTKFYLKWFHKGRELAWSNHMNGNGIIPNEHFTNKDMSVSDSSLTVTIVRPEQFGTYKCEVSEKSLSYEVLLLSVSAEPSSPVLRGETVTLVCDPQRPENQKNQPKIHWLNPQGEKMTQRSVKATLQHNGQWTCVVTLGGKTHQAQIFIPVVDLDSPSSQYTSKSSPLSIPCSIPAPVPWERIKALGLQEGHWQFFPRSLSNRLSPEAQRLFTLSLEGPPTWKPGETRGLTPASNLNNRDLSLSRKKGDNGDCGDYVCTLKFSSGLTLNRTVRVNVLEITSVPGEVLILGQQLNLTCSLGVPLTSDLRLRWLPPETSSLQPPTSDRLAILAVGAEDGGKWRCELWRNSTLLTSAMITLKIEPRLSVWMLVIICSVAAIVLLLLILGFILCRRRRAQRKRHIRHQLCQCKKPKPKGFYRT